MKKFNHLFKSVLLISFFICANSVFSQGAEDVLAYQSAQAMNTVESYEKFIRDYPKSVYLKPANAALKILRTIENFKRYDQQAALAMFKKEQATEIDKITARYANSNDGGETVRRRIAEMLERDAVEFNNYLSYALRQNPSQKKDLVDIFVTLYPNSPYARQYKTSLEQSNINNEWTNVASSRDVEKLEAFIKKYPDGTYAPYARQMIDELKKSQDSQRMIGDYQAAYSSSDTKLIDEFLKKYPNSPYGAALTQRRQAIANEAKAKEERNVYNKALLENSAALWEDFIKSYPDSTYTTAAITQLRAIRDAGRAAVANPQSQVMSSLPLAVVTPNAAVKTDARNELNKADKVFANRRALVIGNDGYIHVNPLANAKNDAKAVAVALEKVSYKVTLLVDQNEKSLKQALRQFKSEVEGGDEVLFFFAGHGVQIAGANYLLPTDIRGDGEDQVKDDAIQLQRLLDDMADRKAKLTLAVIDACRDNPFKSSGRALGGRGLAPTTPATGQMILFSAGSGQKALDNLGPKDKEPNGLFTRTFVKEIQKPGIPVDRVLKNVREKVVTQAKEVGHEQVPAFYDQVIGEFYFRQ